MSDVVLNILRFFFWFSSGVLRLLTAVWPISTLHT